MQLIRVMGLWGLVPLWVFYLSSSICIVPFCVSITPFWVRASPHLQKFHSWITWALCLTIPSHISLLHHCHFLNFPSPFFMSIFDHFATGWFVYSYFTITHPFYLGCHLCAPVIATLLSPTLMVRNGYLVITSPSYTSPFSNFFFLINMMASLSLHLYWSSDPSGSQWIPGRSVTIFYQHLIPCVFFLFCFFLFCFF